MPSLLPKIYRPDLVAGAVRVLKAEYTLRLRQLEQLRSKPHSHPTRGRLGICMGLVSAHQFGRSILLDQVNRERTVSAEFHDDTLSRPADVRKGTDCPSRPMSDLFFSLPHDQERSIKLT